ncbi:MULTISPECIES: hypothetical protein [Paenibacillus]|uniref:hypothetical protein n=1 Tax=Paenibacillus TaxID=44249 RepID=UPI0009A6AC77|nr:MULTISPECIES: hypothetical protein [Paenibacillus]MCZ1268220.1 hypothetical protein [Paenibacillus tundrae]SLK16483.1 hypothetical protein SAMN06272722_110174 [Paenibacillus sp. RU5A]SOC74388.1 hypothetical protein SAMN05880581_110174 [Paenibacillus sp. RU26A]SOC76525.1 hypothetical protein SAMN05880586_110174 [Paenibacillus sp. RU5M]
MMINNHNITLSYDEKQYVYSETLRTTDKYKGPDQNDSIKYVYKLESIDEEESIFIRFVSDVGNLIPKWMAYYFSDEKIDNVDKMYPNPMGILKKESAKLLKDNIDRIREWFMWPSANGKGVFVIEENLKIDIQIMDMQILNSNKELIHQKKGVEILDRPIKISEYRHLLEWLPKERNLTLFNLGIRQSRYPYPLFEVNFSDNSKSVKIDSKLSFYPKLQNATVNPKHWNGYITQVLHDPGTTEVVNKLLEEELQRIRDLKALGLKQ